VTCRPRFFESAGIKKARARKAVRSNTRESADIQPFSHLFYDFFEALPGPFLVALRFGRSASLPLLVSKSVPSSRVQRRLSRKLYGRLPIAGYVLLLARKVPGLRVKNKFLETLTQRENVAPGVV
jgi:hypothetical protein